MPLPRAAFFCLVLSVAGCGTRTALSTEPIGADADADADTDADGSADCTPVCDWLDACNAYEGDSCMRDCERWRVSHSEEAWNAVLVGCMDAPCGQIEECRSEAEEELAPQEYHRRFCDELCNWIEACEEPVEPDCVSSCLRDEQRIASWSEEVIDELLECLEREPRCRHDDCIEGILDQYGLD